MHFGFINLTDVTSKQEKCIMRRHVARMRDVKFFKKLIRGREGKRSIKELGIDGRIILNLMFTNWNVRVRSG